MPIVFKHRIRVTHFSPNGPPWALQEVDAITTDTDGLLVTRCHGDPKLWVITHRQSGTRVTHGCHGASTDVYGLLCVARDLGRVANWRRHAKSLTGSELAVAVRDVLAAAKIEWRRADGGAAVDRASAQYLGGA